MSLREERDVALDDCNTFGLAVTAERLVRVETMDDVAALGQRIAPDTPLHIIAGGSNVICAPRLRSLVCLVRLRGLRRVSDGVIEVAAGENWHNLVRYSVGLGLTGLERLALIPGSVGAAPVQNIGAYGGALDDVLEAVQVFDRHDRQIRWLSRADCEFAYRSSLFKRPQGRHYLILGLRLRLVPDVRRTCEHYPDVALELERMGVPGDTARQRFEAVVRVRRRKLPDVRRYGNVGSVFKNPVVAPEHAEQLRQRLPQLATYPDPSGGVKLAAAALIDRCGWKGRVLDGVLVWPRQALVLVNAGVRDGNRLRAVMNAIAADVRREFGVSLEPEPQLLGFD